MGLEARSRRAETVSPEIAHGLDSVGLLLVGSPIPVVPRPSSVVFKAIALVTGRHICKQFDCGTDTWTVSAVGHQYMACEICDPSPESIPAVVKSIQRLAFKVSEKQSNARQLDRLRQADRKGRDTRGWPDLAPRQRSGSLRAKSPSSTRSVAVESSSSQNELSGLWLMARFQRCAPAGCAGFRPRSRSKAGSPHEAVFPSSRLKHKEPSAVSAPPLATCRLDCKERLPRPRRTRGAPRGRCRPWRPVRRIAHRETPTSRDSRSRRMPRAPIVTSKRGRSVATSDAVVPASGW